MPFERSRLRFLESTSSLSFVVLCNSLNQLSGFVAGRASASSTLYLFFSDVEPGILKLTTPHLCHDPAHTIEDLKEVLRMDKCKIPIKSYLVRAAQPLAVEIIRKQAKIGHRSVCLSNLLVLLIEGKISGQKTSKGWIFWKPAR